MTYNRKYRLNSATSQKDVNVDEYDKVNLKSKVNLLPVGEVGKVINSGEQFNTERNNSTKYRLTGSINSLFNNALFNSTGKGSWEMFNDIEYRDGSFPPNSVTASDENDLTYAESIETHLKERNGWYGYNDLSSDTVRLCGWTEMEPNSKLFSLSPVSETKNWEFTITYPSTQKSVEGDLTYQGLLIIGMIESKVGRRDMMTISTPVKHGLSQGESVQLSGLSDKNGVYKVMRVGKDNGDDKEYNFSIELDTSVTLTGNARMSRIYRGRKSEYYYRMFNTITVDIPVNYEIFPLAFSQNIYEDIINHYVLNEDIDVSGLTDTLNRPLSELYVTLIKTDSNNVFTNIKSGLNIPYSKYVDSFLAIPDVRRINNGLTSNQPLEDNIILSANTFYGDIAEFNILEFEEKILGEVYHTFNTYNRENGGVINRPNFTSSETIDLGSRYEGYMYKAHHKIKIREFSSYIEEGTEDTSNKPDYALPLGDGRYVWRDLLDIGFDDVGNLLDYPFLNGIHYLNSLITLPLLRQDPFNIYESQHTNMPADIPGDEINDDLEIKNSQDVC